VKVRHAWLWYRKRKMVWGGGGGGAVEEEKINPVITTPVYAAPRL